LHNYINNNNNNQTLQNAELAYEIPRRALKYVTYFTQVRPNKGDVRKSEPAINKNFIVSGNLLLDMTQGVQAFGSALLSSMDDDVLEIHSSNYDEVSQIYTYSQLYKLINLYTRIIITLYLVSCIANHTLYICIVLCFDVIEPH
jgi:flagellar biosynthesis protein FlhB